MCVERSRQQFNGKHLTTKESNLHLYSIEKPKSKGQKKSE